ALRLTRANSPNAAAPRGDVDLGLSYLTAVVDQNSNIAEPDEGDNVVTFPFNIAYWISDGESTFNWTDDLSGTNLQDLFVTEDFSDKGLLAFVLNAPGSTFNPNVAYYVEGGSNGAFSDANNINGTTVSANATLGDARVITEGDVISLPMFFNPTNGFTRAAFEVIPGDMGVGATTGDYQFILEKCELAAIAKGQALAGVMEGPGISCNMMPNPISIRATSAEMWHIDLVAGDEIRIDVESIDFDATVFAFNPNGHLSQQDDDGGSGTNSRVGVTIPTDGSEAGKWTIVVSTFAEGELGNYTLTVTEVVNTVTPIVFAATTAGNSEIVDRDATGASFSNLSNNIAVDNMPAWSPDGNQIAFVTDRDGNSEIYLMNADGSAPLNITNAPTDNDLWPRWSPDGSRLAFSSDRSGSWNVWVLNLATLAVSNFTASASVGVTAQEHDWSPTGSSIVFSEEPTGSDAEIFVMDLDGTNRVQLTNDAFRDHRPKFSPDGSKIAFVSDRGGRFDAWIMNADGTSLVNLTPGLPGTTIDAVWSPTGQQLVISSFDPAVALQQLYVIEADGSRLRKISDITSDDRQPDWFRDRSDLGPNFYTEFDAQTDTVLLRQDRSAWSHIGSTFGNNVFNDGTTATYPDPGVTLQLILSGNTTRGDGEDFLQATQVQNVLVRPGGFVHFDFGFPTFNPADFGDNYVFARVDSLNEVAELDEADNESNLLTVPMGAWLVNGSIASERMINGSVGALDDPQDLVADEFQESFVGSFGLIASLIPDIGAAGDLSLGIFNANSPNTSDNENAYAGVFTGATTFPALGAARSIDGGELAALPLNDSRDAFDFPGNGMVLRTALEPLSNTGAAVGYQLRVERCVMVEMSLDTQHIGSLAGTDCVLWPNPQTGLVTPAQMLTFFPSVGDSVSVDVSSFDFDPFVAIFGPDGDYFDSDLGTQDLSGGGVAATLAGRIDQPGVHTIVVSSGAELVPGSYTANLVLAAAAGGVIITDVQADTLVEGSTVTITGGGFSNIATDDTVLVGGVQASVTFASTSQLDIVVPARDCRPLSIENVQVIVGIDSSNVVTRPVAPSRFVDLGVGASTQFFSTGADDYCLQFRPEATDQEFLFGIQSFSDVASELTPVTMTGVTSAVVPAPPMAIRPRQSVAGTFDPSMLSPFARRQQANRVAESQFRSIDRRIFDAMQGLPAASPPVGPELAVIDSNVTVGDTLNVRMVDFTIASPSCDIWTELTVVVRAKGTRGIWLEDVANPAQEGTGGYSMADFDSLSTLFDAFIYDKDVEYFGPPTDADANAREVIVITQEVNRTDGLLGFVHTCDLFDRTAASGSNEGEFYYGKAPDPNNVFGRAFAYTRDDAFADAPFVIAHEFTHTIQFTRRFAAGAPVMATFVAEGQATLAEEVVGHAFEGHAPGQNLGFNVAFNLDDPTSIDWYQNAFVDLLFYYGFVDQNTQLGNAPEECSWIDAAFQSPCGGRPLWYGVTWSLMRWISDVYGASFTGGEQEFHQLLVNNTVNGFANIENSASPATGGRDIEELLAWWANTLYADDRGFAQLGGV
ncbi:MAG: IPT/TIG domain-containing protein, partial [Gemmatimonadales bacterium]